MDLPRLSIVIPAYNESQRIGSSLESILAYVRSRNLSAEIIVVDDASSDNTAELVGGWARSHPEARLLSNSKNRGKGFSVRRGVLEARGEWVLFTDADLSAPIEETDKLVAALEREQAAAAVGSRALERELVGFHQPFFREWSGRFFNILVRLLTGLKIHDTQCGLKLFRREATRRAFELQTSRRFGFDPELLFLIEHTAGRVVEVPVRWDNSPATKVRFLRDSSQMILDLIRIRWNQFRGRYDPGEKK